MEKSGDKGYLFKPTDRDVVLIDLPCGIDPDKWITALKRSINILDIRYIIIQNFNTDVTLIFYKLKFCGVNPTVICSIKCALFHQYPSKLDFDWHFISEKPDFFNLY